MPQTLRTDALAHEDAMLLEDDLKILVILEVLQNERFDNSLVLGVQEIQLSPNRLEIQSIFAGRSPPNPTFVVVAVVQRVILPELLPPLKV